MYHHRCPNFFQQIQPATARQAASRQAPCSRCQDHLRKDSCAGLCFTSLVKLVWALLQLSTCMRICCLPWTVAFLHMQTTHCLPVAAGAPRADRCLRSHLDVLLGLISERCRSPSRVQLHAMPADHQLSPTYARRGHKAMMHAGTLAFSDRVVELQVECASAFSTRPRLLVGL